MTHEGPGGATALPGGYGVNPSAHRDERHRQFFRSVDAALKPFLATTRCRWAWSAWIATWPSWDEVTTHKEFMRATLLGNYDEASPTNWLRRSGRWCRRRKPNACSATWMNWMAM
jgi:hypothetical protein